MMTPIDIQKRKRILLRLSKGVTTKDELKVLCDLYHKMHKENGKSHNSLIEWQSFMELKRRLYSSVFSETGNGYPKGYKYYCIYGEYKNTKLFINLIKKIIKIGLKQGDITNPSFYNQPPSKYKVSVETLIHIIIRHNESINGLISSDSLANGHRPSSFGFGAFVEPMLILFMALKTLKDDDWKKAQTGKNMICHFRVGGRVYTVIRKGQSNKIKSFYPRNDDLNGAFIELERLPTKMEMVKK